MSKQKKSGNKAKHSRLMSQKKNKLRKEKDIRDSKMKELVAKLNKSKQEEEE